MIVPRFAIGSENADEGLGHFPRSFGDQLPASRIALSRDTPPEADGDEGLADIRAVRLAPVTGRRVVF